MNMEDTRKKMLARIEYHNGDMDKTLRAITETPHSEAIIKHFVEML